MHIKYSDTSAKIESLYEMGRRGGEIFTMVKLGSVVSHAWETG
jgi:hypothetical protein